MKPTRKTHPVMKIMAMSILDLPTPINISLWWNYGSLLGLFLFIQITTGMMLAIHYVPNIELAFSSLTHISRNVNWGWMLHNSHMNGASCFMLFMYLHMARGIYYCSFRMKEVWNIGVSIFIASMATAFMGYVLPWGQMSFWGATVITNIFSAIPYTGKLLVEWLWGGFAVANPTLSRFFILHFILPLTIMSLVILHIMFLHMSGSGNPMGINSNSDRSMFHYYYTTKDFMGFLFMLPIFITVVMLTPSMLMDPENYMEANTLITPTHIQPEWYFLWLYAILRSIPNKLGGVVALLLAIFILYLPSSFYLTKMSMSFCPPMQMMFFLMINSWFILSWIGMCPVEQPFISIGQIFSTAYFFLLLQASLNTWWNLNKLLLYYNK